MLIAVMAWDGKRGHMASHLVVEGLMQRVLACLPACNDQLERSEQGYG